jgi:hypothetical protein
VVGSAAALKPTDEIFSQYRESAALMYRGFSVQQMADQVSGFHYKSRRYLSSRWHFRSVLEIAETREKVDKCPCTMAQKNITSRPYHLL